MGDMRRLVADGKSIIIEGYHVSGEIVAKIKSMSDTAVIASFLISPDETLDASNTFQPVRYDKMNPSHALDAMQKSIIDKIKQVYQ
jgi:2-phosphoglycerate kinase